MNKPQKKIGLFLSLPLFCILALCILLWFFAPGVRRIGPFSRFQIQKTGYAIDPNTLEILGQTEVTVNGIGSVFEKSVSDTATKIKSEFSGTVDVAGYRNSDPEYFGTSVDYDDGIFEIRYLNQYFFVEDPETHAGHAGIIGPFYTVWIIPERDSLVAVLVTDFEKNQTVVICTDTPEEALEECQWLKDRFGI